MRDQDDAQLLVRARHEPEAFGTFYARHERAVLGYFVRRVRDAETAADLSAETFAQALLSLERYRGDRGAPLAWLFGIAAHLLASHHRRGAVERRARERLGLMEVRPTAQQLEQIAALEADLQVEVLLGDLPEAQRAAVRARVLDDEDYDAIAARQATTAQAVRQRVSRGLAALRPGFEKGTGR
jgi:RNA polymerase sigma factor (sigma-70 family)